MKVISVVFLLTLALYALPRGEAKKKWLKKGKKFYDKAKPYYDKGKKFYHKAKPYYDVYKASRDEDEDDLGRQA